MTRKDVAKGIVKSLPVVGALAVGVGATIAIINKDKLEDKVADKLIARQITKEHIPLQ
jgi:hypothetical protein|tara:strand:+ start:282 stop:455 length:174 start_codon:yes stop_codon:yes gene_type:complete